MEAKKDRVPELLKEIESLKKEGEESADLWFRCTEKLYKAEEEIESLRLLCKEFEKTNVGLLLERDEYKRRLDIIKRWSRNFPLLGGFTVWDKFLMENPETEKWFEEKRCKNHPIT